MLQNINIFNGFTTFGVVISCIFSFFIKQKELSNEEKDKLNKNVWHEIIKYNFYWIYDILSFYYKKH